MISLNILDFFLFFVPGFIVLVIEKYFSTYGKEHNEINKIFWAITYSGIIYILVHALIAHLKLSFEVINWNEKITDDPKSLWEFLGLYTLCTIAVGIILCVAKPWIKKLIYAIQTITLGNKYDDASEPWDSAFRGAGKSGLLVSVVHEGSESTGWVKHYTGTVDSKLQIVLHGLDAIAWLRKFDLLDAVLDDPTHEIIDFDSGYLIKFYDEKRASKRYHKLIEAHKKAKTDEDFKNKIKGELDHFLGGGEDGAGLDTVT